MLTTADTHASRLMALLDAMAAHARRYGHHTPELLFAPAVIGWWLVLYTGTAVVAARVNAWSEVERTAVTVSTDHTALELLAAPLDGLTVTVRLVLQVCQVATEIGAGAEFNDITVDPAELASALDGLAPETPCVLQTVHFRDTRSLSVADLANRWRVFIVEAGPETPVAESRATRVTAHVPLDAVTTRELLRAIFSQETAMLCPVDLLSLDALDRADSIRRALLAAECRVIL